MKRLPAVLAAAGILIAIGGCGENPTAVRSADTKVPQFTTTSAGNITFGIQDSLTAGANGKCDLPLTITNNSGVQASFGSATVTISSTAFSIPEATMQGVKNPIPTGTSSGTLSASSIGSSATAPYSGSWALNWAVDGVNYSGSIYFTCHPNLPHVTKPCYEYGSPVEKYLANKYTYLAFVENGCTGYTVIETVYEFRAEDGTVAWPSSMDFYSYGMGDPVEAYWH